MDTVIGNLNIELNWENVVTIKLNASVTTSLDNLGSKPYVERACLVDNPNVALPPTIIASTSEPISFATLYEGVTSRKSVTLHPLLASASNGADVAILKESWRNAMYDEYNELVNNGTWLLVPRPACVNMVRSMWLFKHKFHAGGTLSRYKARLVANGSSQQLGVDFDETFSLVIKPATTRLLSQKNYAFDLLARAHMVNCNPEPHFAALKHILRYVHDTLELGLHIYAFTTTSLVGYTNTEWAAEYWSVANVVAETAWLHNLLCELHFLIFTATLVYCDNVSAVYMYDNPIQHQRTKHIEIDIHFVCDMVKAGHVRVLHIPSRFQYADIFTKGLPSVLFEDFRSSLSVHPPPAQTTRAY
uniref:Ribonuclease H-like domain-containing protein n=1 Tax=Tanacetum cinerariifolium TaxID=118510 RepID=A0A699H1Y3_TANCI|nr:ribonuclease H-like domain-containing protein [Tanacetum cinerariifolium]